MYYEIEHSDKAPEAEKERVLEAQEEMFRAMPTPPGVNRIQSF